MASGKELAKQFNALEDEALADVKHVNNVAKLVGHAGDAGQVRRPRGPRSRGCVPTGPVRRIAESSGADVGGALAAARVRRFGAPGPVQAAPRA